MEKDVPGRVATVGTFDGLHRGHRRVIQLVKDIARERGLDPLVISFDRHPLETVAPDRAPLLIQSPSERTNALFREGLGILTLEFTPALAALSAEEWLRRIHHEHGVEVLVVGYDNTFGRDGVNMNLSDYRRIGAGIGIEVVEAPFIPHVSSSAIRRLLKEGRIEEANSFLGRPFAVSGTVTEGKHLGSSIGFPTANVVPSYRALLPARGVYAVEVELPSHISVPGHSDRMGLLPAVANVGVQPTVASGLPECLEVHIPNFSGNLYGQRVKVFFLRRIRDEIRFPSLDALKSRISLDIQSLSP